MISGAAYYLHIHVSATKHQRGKPLYELIIQTARSLSMAGASVLSVEMSYGTAHQIHDLNSDYGLLDLPVIIEIVDQAEQI